MFTGGEVITLFVALLGPIGTAFGVLFLAYRKSNAELARNLQAQIVQLRTERDTKDAQLYKALNGAEAMARVLDYRQQAEQLTLPQPAQN